jgi:hypothetical protein
LNPNERQVQPGGVGTSGNFVGFRPVSAHLAGRNSYANFLNRLSVKRIEEDYAGLF